jgi:uncharacterized protein (DUF58 family)
MSKQRPEIPAARTLKVPELTGIARSLRIHAPRHEDAEASPINISDVAEIELLILRRMREVTIGDHRSLSHGTGFDYVGLRDWQAGDRFSTIDWPQSTLTNFSPLIVREFEQPSTATVLVVADASLSTRCGAHGVPIASLVARAIATIGMSAVFFQDRFGLATFDDAGQQLAAIRPRIGRTQVMHCLDAYQHQRGLQQVRDTGSMSMTIGSFMRKTALIAFVSDFLFDAPRAVLDELSLLNAAHDVFIVLIDAAFAFELPHVSSGWVETIDVETGRTRVMSRAALRDMAERVRAWQTDVASTARDVGLDVIRFGTDLMANQLALAEFVAERRLRKVA